MAVMSEVHVAPRIPRDIANWSAGLEDRGEAIGSWAEQFVNVLICQYANGGYERYSEGERMYEVGCMMHDWRFKQKSRAQILHIHNCNLLT